MSRYTYEDGGLCVVVESGMPQDAVRIGVGDTWREAVDSLETTAIQSTGRDGGVAAALRWASSNDWISSADIDEVDVDLDVELRLRADASTEHEDAEEMWSSLGNHWTWEAWDGEHCIDGQVVHPACTVEQLDTLTDAQIVAAECAIEASDEERGAYEEAIAYARQALEDMRGVAAQLDAATAAYARRDVDATIEALRTARIAEDEYGDWPATRTLAEEMLVDVDEVCS